MYNTIVKRHKKLYMNENPLCGSNIGPIISRVQVGNSKFTLQKSQKWTLIIFETRCLCAVFART